MSNYDGKIELPQTYHNQGNERYLSSDKPDTYLWLAEENTKQAKQIERLQEQLNEANEIIKGYLKLESLMNCALGPMENCPSQKYFKKWNIK